jgi:Fe-S cluster biogenesis protein NfuA
MHEPRREFTRRSERIEELVSRVQSAGDTATRAVAQELLQAVIELHGVAIERIVDALAATPGGETALAAITKDELVSGVLSLHGIHPVPIGDRVAAALEFARPYLRSHGGDVELESIENGVVRLRLRGACGSCSSSTETMKRTIEEAIYDAAPEVTTIISESAPAAAHSELVTLRAG